ncbi:bifunctional riboflavin kinase/FAD synthetase [uncultured Merdimonas sp.]|uniref:bifunctional riboflavin kinase/FAD synthetase n=1 Tax=uncultured Merdimonas sp. TaxID=2023269 RepID=UPI003207EAEF
MQYIKELSQYQSGRESAVTFGKFDGLHRGHQKLVSKVRELSTKENLNSIVCAFDMHPLWKEKGITPQIIMDQRERYLHLDGVVDVLVECPFTPDFARMRAEAFIEEIICRKLHARYVVVGTDFHFGYEKKGDVHMLAAYAETYGYQLFVIEKERYQDRIISSTYIKEVLRTGDVGKAAELLGYYYGADGVVEHGRRLGRTLGFPTVNLHWPAEKIAPPNGVYFGRVRVDGSWHPAISNVGVKPTVSRDGRLLVESYLLDYEGDAYGKEILTELMAFHRPERRFETVDALKEQVDRDIACGRKFFETQKQQKK